ncbi:hypothetical protein HMPREF1981_02631 [Bacteroides pyogenes F0041]|uniref:Uncharacterized protein n=1 Tax=Bacteroides pyogenes F0041 TaxID=1321819 RepID=U2CDN4_9BACE|nr:hypothetical protein HMPREF1981_02631 [Bacteroides pyogenes F0041]
MDEYCISILLKKQKPEKIPFSVQYFYLCGIYKSNTCLTEWKN